MGKDLRNEKSLGIKTMMTRLKLLEPQHSVKTMKETWKNSFGV